MCDPVSISLIAATAVTATGQAVGAAQSAATYRYQAKVADRNAQLANDQAADSIAQNKVDAQRLYRKAGQTEGQQNAAMAANGVDLGFGSALQVQSDTKMLTSEDAGQLYRQGFNDTKGFEINASNERAKAQGAEQAASGAITKGIFDVGSTVLGGATQFSKYRAGNK